MNNDHPMKILGLTLGFVALIGGTFGLFVELVIRLDLANLCRAF